MAVSALGAVKGCGNSFTKCCAGLFGARRASARNPPPPFWIAKRCVRPITAGRGVTMQARRSKGASATSGGHLGLAALGLCDPGRCFREGRRSRFPHPSPSVVWLAALYLGRSRLSGGSFWSLGRRASQDQQPALGNCPPSPKPARLQSAGQALDRRAHLRLVYEAPPPGTRLRNQNRKCGGYASPYDDRRDAEARPLTTKKCFLKQTLRSGPMDSIADRLFVVTRASCSDSGTCGTSPFGPAPAAFESG